MSKFNDELRAFLGNTINLYRELKEKNQSIEERDHKLHVLEVLESIDLKSLDIEKPLGQPKAACREISEFSDFNNYEDHKLGAVLDFLLKNYRVFDWRHGYLEIDRTLADNYAFTEIVGRNGIIKGKDISLGFVLLSRDTIYPDHFHKYVDETYINIGKACRINERKLNAGDIGYIARGQVHRIESHSQYPAFLLYSWTGMGNSSMEDNLKFV